MGLACMQSWTAMLWTNSERGWWCYLLMLAVKVQWCLWPQGAEERNTSSVNVWQGQWQMLFISVGSSLLWLADQPAAVEIQGQVTEVCAILTMSCPPKHKVAPGQQTAGWPPESSGAAFMLLLQIRICFQVLNLLEDWTELWFSQHVLTLSLLYVLSSATVIYWLCWI